MTNREDTTDCEIGWPCDEVSDRLVWCDPCLSRGLRK